MTRSQSEKVPAGMAAAFAAIVEVTDAFCRDHLNDEYAGLARQLAASLARKRPSPLERGAPETWACGITYALGSVNFLFDPDQQPHMSAAELCNGFGVKQRTGAAKARLIRDTFGMYPLDPDWCLPSLADHNPQQWMLKVNGFIVDIRYMPRDVQELAYLKGLIPYIPADRVQE
jgi:hypothetical protein